MDLLQKVATLMNRVDAMDNRFDAMDNRFDGIDNRVDAMDSQVIDTQRQISKDCLIFKVKLTHFFSNSLIYFFTNPYVGMSQQIVGYHQFQVATIHVGTALKK